MKPLRAIGLAIALLLTLGLSVWLYSKSSINQHEIMGIDVSHHQGVIDWTLVSKADVKFAYLKATEGGDFVDPKFYQNWDHSRQSGIHTGAYHFFTLCTPAEKQAVNFINTVGDLDNALPPVLDAEHMGPCRKGPTMTNPAMGIEIFQTTIVARYGVRPIIYTTSEFHNAHLRGLTGEQFWIRSLFKKPNFRQNDWVIWQYNNRGKIEGISGPVDLNKFKGDQKALQKLLVRKN